MRKSIAVPLILMLSIVSAMSVVADENFPGCFSFFESGYMITDGKVLPNGYLAVSGVKELTANGDRVSFLAIYNQTGDRIGYSELERGDFYIKGMVYKDTLWVLKAKESHDKTREIHSVVYDPVNSTIEQPYGQEMFVGVTSYCFENEIVTLCYEANETWQIRLDGYDTLCNKVWSSTLSFAEDFRVLDIQKTEDGYIACGGIKGERMYPGFVWKLDRQGNLLWVYEDQGNGYPFNEVIMIENKAIVAKSQSTDRAVMIDADGSLLHTESFYKMGIARIQNITSFENGFVLLGMAPHWSYEYGSAKYTLLYLDEHMEMTHFYILYAMAGQQGNLGVGAGPSTTITLFGNTRANTEEAAIAFFSRVRKSDLHPISEFVYPAYTVDDFEEGTFFTF